MLLVGEGRETEPNYFRELCGGDSVRQRFRVSVKPGSGFSPEAVVKEAVRHKERAERRGEDYEETWCVLDVESGADKRASLHAATELANAHGVRLCLSNPSFEVWLLAHFVRSSRAYQDCAAVIVELNKYWQEEWHLDYDKADKKLYQRVASRTSDAVRNAKLVLETDHRDKADTKDANSSTEVYRLVERFTS